MQENQIPITTTITTTEGEGSSALLVEFLDRCAKELKCTGDQQSILNCAKENIQQLDSMEEEAQRHYTFLRTIKPQAKKTIIRMTAERLKELATQDGVAVAVNPHSICSILTKALAGIVPARTIRMALGDEFKSVYHSKNAKNQTPHGHKEKERTKEDKEKDFAALMPQQQQPVTGTCAAEKQIQLASSPLHAKKISSDIERPPSSSTTAAQAIAQEPPSPLTTTTTTITSIAELGPYATSNYEFKNADYITTEADIIEGTIMDADRLSKNYYHLRIRPGLSLSMPSSSSSSSGTRSSSQAITSMNSRSSSYVKQNSTNNNNTSHSPPISSENTNDAIGHVCLPKEMIRLVKSISRRKIPDCLLLRYRRRDNLVNDAVIVSEIDAKNNDRSSSSVAMATTTTIPLSDIFGSLLVETPPGVTNPSGLFSFRGSVNLR